MTLNIIVVQDKKVDCPKYKEKVTLNTCMSCRRLRMMNPRDGGEVQCRDRDSEEVRDVKITRWSMINDNATQPRR